MKKGIENAILFRPKKQILKNKGNVVLSSLKFLYYSPEAEYEAEILRDGFFKKFAINLQLRKNDVLGAQIYISSEDKIFKAPVAPKKSEGFVINISANVIFLSGHDPAGLFYAIQSFMQISENESKLKYIAIRDWPDLPMRAYHMDLKKGILKKKELYKFIDRLAELRINTILLEYEDRFAYKSHPTLAASDALSPKNAKALAEYAKKRHIKIIPLLQSLGHVEYVLQSKQYAHLREFSDAISQYCPSNPETFKLFKSFFEELLEVHSDSEYFHIGGDETALLGKCPACKKIVDKKGKTALYVNYIKKVCELVLKSGKRPILWDDMLTRSGDPELLKKLPKGTAVMYWDYRDEDSACGQFLIEGSRVSRKWIDKIANSKDFAGAPQGFSGYWEELPEKIKKIYLPYLKNKEFPLKSKTFPYIELIQNMGYEVIGASSLRCGADRVLPDTPGYMSNIKNWAIRGKETGIKGVVATSWAAASTFGPPSCAVSLCDHLLAASGVYSWNAKTKESEFSEAYDMAVFGIKNGELQKRLRLASLSKNETYCNWIEHIVEDIEEMRNNVTPEARELFGKYLAAVKVLCYERTLRCSLRKVEDRFFPGSPASRQPQIVKGAENMLKNLSKELNQLKTNFKKLFQNDFSQTPHREAVNAIFAIYEARLKTADILIKRGKK
jgi:glycosyl hydrolase family 20